MYIQIGQATAGRHAENAAKGQLLSMRERKLQEKELSRN